MLSKKDRWDLVRNTWEQATSFARSYTSKILEGKVSKETRNLRILSCHGIDEEGKQIKSPCHARGYSKEKAYHFCNSCSCGQREIARLSSVGSTENQPVFNEDYIKLDFPTLSCPRQMPGFSNYSGDENIVQ